MIRAASRLLAGAVIACLAACASAPMGAPTGASRNAMPDAVRAAPERYVIVTVRDVRPHGNPTSGSGYARYGPSRQARAAVAGIASDYALHEAVSWPIALLRVHCVVYTLPPTRDARELLARLAADRRVESVQPLATFTTHSSPYNDPYANLQNSLELMNVAEAQQWSRGDGVRIAIVDTGVDVTHPDLEGRIATRRNFVDADAHAFATDAHGTAVAGVIAAVANNHVGIAGIAPDVQLLLYKACWKDAARPGGAVCNSFTLAQAIAAAVGAHVGVVNLSLAGPSDPLLARLVAQGLRKGIVFVGAAPPDGAAAGFPGDVRGVVTVDAPGRRGGVPAMLVAPGLDVLTLVPGAHYDFASGSSLAAAQTSAVIALMRSANPRLRADEIPQLLARTSRSVSSASGAYVAINACAALVAVRQQGRCATAVDADFAQDREYPSPPPRDP